MQIFIIARRDPNQTKNNLVLVHGQQLIGVAPDLKMQARERQVTRDQVVSDRRREFGGHYLALNAGDRYPPHNVRPSTEVHRRRFSEPWTA